MLFNRNRSCFKKVYTSSNYRQKVRAELKRNGIRQKKRKKSLVLNIGRRRHILREF